MPTPTSVALAYEPWKHHSEHSGYHQLARYLAQRMPVVELESGLGRVAPKQLIVRAFRHSGLRGYNETSLGLETAVARRLLRKSGEVCHVLYGEEAFQLLALVSRLARARRNRIVASFHQPPSVFPVHVRRTGHLRKLDAMIAVSPHQADFLAPHAGKRTRIFVVPHGIDTTFWRPGARHQRESTSCLLVGHWLRDFEAMATVVERMPDVSFTVVLASGHVSQLERMPNVRMLRNISEQRLLLAYQSADLLVMPLLDCTANNGILEALGCALPIVTTDVGAVRFYLNDGCAAIEPKGDAHAIRATVRMLLNDDDARAQMARAARRRALELDWTNVVDELIAVYASII
jgi:glycosyltransferase involved in cell wall biosynthesis